MDPCGITRELHETMEHKLRTLIVWEWAIWARPVAWFVLYRHFGTPTRRKTAREFVPIGLDTDDSERR